MTLQWGPPETLNGVITHYSLQRNGITIGNFSSSVLMYTIEGLSPDTVYVLQLRAHTGAGAGPPNSRTVITSKLCSGCNIPKVQRLTTHLRAKIHIIISQRRL